MLRGLLKAWKNNRAAWTGLRRFNHLPAWQKHLVFYAESEADWAYLEPIVAVLEHRGRTVVRICSDKNDPALQRPYSFYVGLGSPRTILFRTIAADAFAMSLTDLQMFHLKRSVNPVHYFYVFHSIASTHRVYQLHAFDSYDTILCVGPHHEREIRRTEAVYGLPAKRLVKHGYGRLDTLIRSLSAIERQTTPRQNGPRRVLLAPTWGDSSLVNHGLDLLLAILLRAGFHVTLRFHPMTRRHLPRLAEELAAKFSSAGTLRIDPLINTTQSLLDADIMISEWSGAPLDYAFSRLRPVLFIDTPPKVHNPEHGRLELPYLEEEIRGQIGRILPPDRFQDVPGAIEDLIVHAADWQERIRAVRAATVYNVGHSGEAGADAILESLSAQGR